MLGTNPETVRRWIRDKKLIATQSSKKAGNMVDDVALSSFLKAFPKYTVGMSAISPMIAALGGVAIGGATLLGMQHYEKYADSATYDTEAVNLLINNEINTCKEQIKAKAQVIESLNTEIEALQKRIVYYEDLRCTLTNIPDDSRKDEK